MAEDKALEHVPEIKENGAEDKEIAKDLKDEVGIKEESVTNNVEEMEVDKDPAKGLDTIDENVNASEKVEHNDDVKEEKNEKDEKVEKDDFVVEEGKNLDTAKENDEATETVEKEVEMESESEKPDDVEGKQDGVVDSNGLSVEGQESEKDDVEEKELKKPRKAKSGTKKATDKSKDVQEPKTPAASSFSVDRPVRQRKSVERLVAVIERDSSKEFHIEQGSGTALKDIPNVAYKLSRRKSDDTLKLLHSILFSRRGKAADIKQNISKFSGYVLHGNEEKQKSKIMEKLEKCNKEKLFEFCDFLDITIASKATIKKDEVVTMLLEFLVSPHATTDELHAEKEESSKDSKRKRADKGTPGTGSASAKSRKKQVETGKSDDKTNSAETEDESVKDTKENEDGASDEALAVPETIESTEEELPKKSSSEENLSEPENQTDDSTKNKKRKRTSKKQDDSDAKTPKKASNSKKTTSASTKETSEGKTKKTSSLKKTNPSTKATPRSTKKLKIDADKVNSPNVSSKKQKDVKPIQQKNVAASKDKNGKGVSEGKEKTGEEQVKLTDERLREEAVKILKEVDFNTATFTDILKILAERFKTDLTPRKSVIKVMIQEELTKLADEVTENEDGKHHDEDAAAPMDETHPSTSQKV